MTEEQIKYMVSRFLQWKLPPDFRPDAGISFKAEFNENTEHPMRHEPVGTNLLSASQTKDMVRFMLEGLPPAVEEVHKSPESRRVDAYLDTVGRLEPEIAPIDHDAAMASIAISLRRIGDQLAGTNKKGGLVEALYELIPRQ